MAADRPYPRSWWQVAGPAESGVSDLGRIGEHATDRGGVPMRGSLSSGDEYSLMVGIENSLVGATVFPGRAPEPAAFALPSIVRSGLACAWPLALHLRPLRYAPGPADAAALSYAGSRGHWRSADRDPLAMAVADQPARDRRGRDHRAAACQFRGMLRHGDVVFLTHASH